MKTIHDALENVEEGVEGLEVGVPNLENTAPYFVQLEAEMLITTILGTEIRFYLN